MEVRYREEKKGRISPFMRSVRQGGCPAQHQPFWVPIWVPTFATTLPHPHSGTMNDPRRSGTLRGSVEVGLAHDLPVHKMGCQMLPLLPGDVPISALTTPWIAKKKKEECGEEKSDGLEIWRCFRIQINTNGCGRRKTVEIHMGILQMKKSESRVFCWLQCSKNIFFLLGMGGKQMPHSRLALSIQYLPRGQYTCSTIALCHNHTFWFSFRGFQGWIFFPSCSRPNLNTIQYLEWGKNILRIKSASVCVGIFVFPSLLQLLKHMWCTYSLTVASWKLIVGNGGLYDSTLKQETYQINTGSILCFHMSLQCLNNGERNCMLALAFESRCFNWTRYTIILTVWWGCCLLPWNLNRCNYSGKRKASAFSLCFLPYTFSSSPHHNSLKFASISISRA